ncbi:hypothetical protein DQ397_004229 [Pseudomonas sp. CK-NBRI-02]|uniref:hypothetical protein n=1 Tax=Pseudomonas sp. CK-NBRI-02 TaxID=2249759 RepID=UPI0005BE0DD6|nr:hypothetical protein [Pseudomonas sp. CK-NBRI-02]TYO70646.1 hypothetical protein DQ397_004229 [Pseudomonas sp. CK-NBRI-02]
MKTLEQAQILQLKLIESAAVNESCAKDLMGILRKLSYAEANNIIDIINLLNIEADQLRVLSRQITTLH